MHTIVIVRHGRTFAEGEVPRRIGSSTDLPLTETGYTQAEALGAHFASRGMTFDHIMCGPLRRTRDSARLIASRMSLATPVLIADWLVEIDHGPDENQPEDAVVARVGLAAIEAWQQRGEPPPGWKVDALERLAQWRQMFATRAREAGASLFVTSNGAARFALLALSDLPLASLTLGTGAYGEIELSDNAAPRLIKWNARPTQP